MMRESGKVNEGGESEIVKGRGVRGGRVDGNEGTCVSVKRERECV